MGGEAAAIQACHATRTFAGRAGRNMVMTSDAVAVSRISDVADLDTRNRLHVGWYELHPDVSLNFQLNRWAATGGPAWVADVRPVLGSLRGLDVWRDKFVRLGEVALAEGRLLHAALHFRCAEFFMVRSDPRKEPLRKRLLKLFCQAAGVATSTRREVPFGNLRLPAWHFPAKSANGTMVVFGGFDSYIEEFFPILAAIQQKGWSVIGFEGPGQGSVLEEQKAPLIPDWHGPVGAVLDAFNLDDVTLVGISLGGCLAIRAAAFEPRVRRVVAFDVLSDFFDSLITTHPGRAGPFVRGMLAVVGADIVIDRALSMVARHSPVVEWGVRKPVMSSAPKGRHRRCAQRKPCKRTISPTASNNMCCSARARTTITFRCRSCGSNCVRCRPPARPPPAFPLRRSKPRPTVRLATFRLRSARSPIGRSKSVIETTRSGHA